MTNMDDLDVQMIDIKEIGFRGSYSDKPSGAFLKSIEDRGVIQPIIVAEVPVHSDFDYRYKVVDGRRRVLACRELDITEIPCVISADDNRLTLLLNNLRTANPIVELRAMEQLIRDGANERDLAGLMGISVSQVRTRLRLSAMCMELRELYEQGVMAQGVAMQASKLNEDDQRRLVDLYNERDAEMIDLSDLSNPRITAADVKMIRSTTAENIVQGLDIGVIADNTPKAASNPYVDRQTVQELSTLVDNAVLSMTDMGVLISQEKYKEIIDKIEEILS